jgi:hypothetical protein
MQVLFGVQAEALQHRAPRLLSRRGPHFHLWPEKPLPQRMRLERSRSEDSLALRCPTHGYAPGSGARGRAP